MENTIIPYELPERENHSFFFISQSIEPTLEARLHEHDAWELYCVLKGKGHRMAGDTLMEFSEGDVVLIPPSMHHQWAYEGDSVDKSGRVRYLMAAFSHPFVLRMVESFPEVRNAMTSITFPTEALKYTGETARRLQDALARMEAQDDLGRLCEMLRLLPVIFTSGSWSIVGRPVRIERDVRRMQQVSEYVMAHYVQPITLDEIAAEVGMNRSAFCSWFKRQKGVTFSEFVRDYRLNTACTLLKTTQKQVSEICYLVGFNDLPHFVRVFTAAKGKSPSAWRKEC